MSEPTSDSFLEHATKNPSQYSDGWRQICQELLDARKRIKELEQRNVADAPLNKALTAWAKWYSARLERINAGAKEDYTGYEQDLFEALGCSTEPVFHRKGAPPPPEEKNKRLSKGTDGKERPWTPHERYMLFAKGFRSGAGVRAIDPNCEGLGAYDRGYDEGITARREAVSRYAEEIGYVPSILRTQDLDSPEGNDG